MEVGGKGGARGKENTVRKESKGIGCSQLMYARSHKCWFAAVAANGPPRCIATATPSIFFFFDGQSIRLPERERERESERERASQPRLKQRMRMNACTMPMHLGWGGYGVS